MIITLLPKASRPSKREKLPASGLPRERFVPLVLAVAEKESYTGYPVILFPFQRKEKSRNCCTLPQTVIWNTHYVPQVKMLYVQ